PFCGFSLAVSGRTSPLAVVSSSSTGLMISRSPRGFSFIRYLRCVCCWVRCSVRGAVRPGPTARFWHSRGESANERNFTHSGRGGRQQEVNRPRKPESGRLRNIRDSEYPGGKSLHVAGQVVREPAGAALHDVVVSAYEHRAGDGG